MPPIRVGGPFSIFKHDQGCLENLLVAGSIGRGAGSPDLPDEYGFICLREMCMQVAWRVSFRSKMLLATRNWRKLRRYFQYLIFELEGRNKAC